MHFLWSLFAPRRPARCFARLDRDGRCSAFKQCGQAPQGADWVEIEEIRLNWLHQPLPASARIRPRTAHSRLHPALSI